MLPVTSGSEAGVVVVDVRQLGTTSTVLQFGHLPRLPAAVSATFILCPQFLQLNPIMFVRLGVVTLGQCLVEQPL